mgnify:CR=1 FL=1
MDERINYYALASVLLAAPGRNGILLTPMQLEYLDACINAAYETKTNRKKLTGAYSDKSPLVKAVALDTDEQMVVYSTDGRAAIFSTAQLLPKTTRNTQGVAVMSLKKKAVLSNAVLLTESGIVNESRYRLTATIRSHQSVDLVNNDEFEIPK